MRSDDWRLRCTTGLLCIAGGVAILVVFGLPDLARGARPVIEIVEWDGVTTSDKHLASVGLLGLFTAVFLPLAACGAVVAGTAFFVWPLDYEGRLESTLFGFFCVVLAAPALSASHLEWIARADPDYSLLLAGAAALSVGFGALCFALAVLAPDYPPAQYDPQGGEVG